MRRAHLAPIDARRGTRAVRRTLSVVLVVLAAMSWPAPAGAADEDPAAAWRRWVEKEFLLGRIDQPFVDDALWAARDPIALWPLALRDLWWRPTPDPELRHVYEAAAARAPRALEPPYRWLLGGGDGAFPGPDPDLDPWPVLTALVRDRQQRESRGRRGLPTESPLATLPPRGTEGQEQAWWDWWRASFLADVMHVAFAAEGIRAYTPDDEAERTRLDAAARSRRSIHLGLAGALVVVLGTVAWRLGRRLGPKADDGEARR